MKICIISDTHNRHIIINDLPDADVIIHCGDLTSMGYEHQINSFLRWFSNLHQYKHKIFIAGNHDWLFETSPALAKTLIPDNVIYLEDSGVEIDGIKFYGTPVCLPFFNWAFYKTEDKIQQHWNAIPEDTDVLITHSPPYGILDLNPNGESCGSKSLFVDVMERIKPKIHCFGHLHDNNGVVELNEIKFINAGICNNKNECTYEPILIEI